MIGTAQIRRSAAAANVLRYERLYDRMDQLNQRNRWVYLLTGVLCLVAFVSFALFLYFVNKNYFVSLFRVCNPYLLIALWFISIALIIGLSKLLSLELLFVEPAFGVTISIIIALSIAYVVFYYCFFKQKKTEENK